MIKLNSIYIYRPDRRISSGVSFGSIHRSGSDSMLIGCKVRITSNGYNPYMYLGKFINTKDLVFDTGEYAFHIDQLEIADMNMFIAWNAKNLPGEELRTHD